MTTDEKLDKIISLLEELLTHFPKPGQQWCNYCNRPAHNGVCAQMQTGQYLEDYSLHKSIIQPYNRHQRGNWGGINVQHPKKKK